METTKPGLIQRTNDKSFFLRFHEASVRASELLDDAPSFKGKPVQVLQILLTIDGYVFAEVIKVDYSPL